MAEAAIQRSLVGNGRAGGPQGVHDRAVALGGLRVHRNHLHAGRCQESPQLRLVLFALGSRPKAGVQLSEDDRRHDDAVQLL